MSRRSALKAGFLGALGLSSADLLRLRAQGAAKRSNKSVILLWLDGGPSHLETYDPKPEASSAYRGPWGALETNVSGIRISEQLPLHAKHADKMVFLRSVHHKTGDHFAGAHWMLTGRFGSTTTDKEQKYPSLGSIVSRTRGANAPGVPAYVGLPAAQSVYLFPGYQGAAYLGPAFNPFDVNTAQKYLAASHTGPVQKPQCLENFTGDAARTQSRVDLLTQLDGFRRGLDRGRLMDAMDLYQQQAVDMVTGNRAREAFDIEKEDAKTRDRYGRGPWGHYTLLARRLVESGVSFLAAGLGLMVFADLRVGACRAGLALTGLGFAVFAAFTTFATLAGLATALGLGAGGLRKYFQTSLKASAKSRGRSAIQRLTWSALKNAPHSSSSRFSRNGPLNSVR